MPHRRAGSPASAAVAGRLGFVLRFRSSRARARRRRLTTPARARSLARNCTARPGVESRWVALTQLRVRKSQAVPRRVRKSRFVPPTGAKTGLRTPKAVAGRAPSRVSAGRVIRHRSGRVRKWQSVPPPDTKTGLRTRASRKTVLPPVLLADPFIVRGVFRHSAPGWKGGPKRHPLGYLGFRPFAPMGLPEPRVCRKSKRRNGL